MVCLTESVATTYAPLFLQSIGQIAVGVWKVWLKFNGSSIRVNGQLYQPEWINQHMLNTLVHRHDVIKTLPSLPLFIVHTGQVPVDDGVVRTQR